MAQSQRNPDTHAAVRYLTALFKPDDIVCLTFIHGTKTYANGGAVTENIFTPLSKVINESGIKRLTKRNAQEHVFVSMAPFKPGSKNRTKSNIAEVRHLFMDADERGEEVLAAVKAAIETNEIPAPTVIIRSSPGKYQFVWNVEGFDIALQEAMNRTLQQKFGTDAQAVDAARVLRVPGFKNIKSKYDPHPTAEIVEHNHSVYTFTLGDFDIPLAVEPDRAKYPVASDETVRQNIEFLETAMDAADVGHSHPKAWEGSGGAYKFDLSECPWRENHSDGRPSDAIAIVQPSGAYAFKCLHAHCADKKWEHFRQYLQDRAGKPLSFSAQPPAPKSLGAAAAIELARVPMVPRAFTQLGNAERYVDLYGQDTKYVAAKNLWLVWNGSRWVPDEMLKVKTQMLAMIRMMVQEGLAAMAPSNTEEERARGEELHKWARSCERDVMIVGSMKMLETMVVTKADIFDENDWLLNFPNGTLELNTGHFRECRREDYITRSIPFDYDEGSTACPQWMKFLREAFPKEHAEKIPYLQRAVGYCLTGDTSEQSLWLLLGKGRNGKGVFVHTLQKMLGDYQVNADWQTFTHHKSTGLDIREDIVRLKDARFVAASENDKTVRLAENIVKTVTGDDIITARKQYQGSQEFKPKFKLWLASNHEPKIIGQDDGIWSRLRYIEFTESFLGREDKGLEKRLRQELPGILNWALEGLRDWQINGIQTPDSVRHRTEEFRKGSDQINTFFDDKISAHIDGRISKAAMYTLYKNWATNGGEFVINEREFNASLQQRGVKDRRFNTGVFWIGIYDRSIISFEKEADKERAKIDEEIDF